MPRLYLKLCALIGCLSLAVSAQTPNQNRVPDPTQDEIANFKRLQELLRHPTFVTLRLVSAPRSIPREDPTDTPAPYKVKDYIAFELFITQNSFEEFTIWTPLSACFQCRPELRRDGEVIPYNKGVQKLIDSEQPEAQFNGSGAPATYKPGREYGPNRIDLSNWYEPLEPGRYQLIVRKRFVWDGDWVPSNPVYLEVVAKPVPAPIPVGLTLELEPQGVEPKKDGAYQLTNETIIQVFIRNNSERAIKVGIVDFFYSVRPQLFKDKDLLPYREDTEQTVISREQKPPELAEAAFIDPGSRTALMYIRLGDWYSSLSPGSYRLLTRHRFEIDGPWTAESPPLLFEVLPAQQK